MKKLFLILFILSAVSISIQAESNELAYVKPDYVNVSINDDDFDDEEGSEEEQENEEIEENA